MQINNIQHVAIVKAYIPANNVQHYTKYEHIFG